jgi:fatty-acyl-CoA synthase
MDEIEWHLATVFERICDSIPDQTAMVHGRWRLTYRDFDQRAGRLAAALETLGVGADVNVALYMHNCPQYKETEFAAAKIRGTVINVNYRYLEDELVYLLETSTSEVLVFQSRFAERVAAIRNRLRVRHFIQIDDGDAEPLDWALDYETLIRNHPPAPRRARPPSDGLITFTGGTTGMPKGVVYTHENTLKLYTFGYEFYGLPTPATTSELLSAVTDLVADGAAPVCLVTVPYMHGTGSGVGHTMTTLMGGTVITMEGRSFDAHEAWSLVEAERVTQLVIVGDAIARPLLDALREAKAKGRPYDIASVRLIASAGVMWTKEIKRGLLDFADMKLIDFFGSTEGGMGMSVATRAEQPETAHFRARPGTKLLDDAGQEIPWGAGRVGRLAATGAIPHEYYKDPARTAQTFLRFGGVLYSVPGDYATIDADGVITVLGRGSACINSGGEKVFAEEVEEAIKRHESVYDCIVVGVPDARWGQSVAAVVSLRPGRHVEAEALREHVHRQLSGYKAPRTIVFVDEVRRAPNGKADYRWASAAAAAGEPTPTA